MRVMILLSYIFAGFTIIGLIKRGIHDPHLEITSIVLSISILCITIASYLIMKWFRDGDLDPKFSKIIFLMLFANVLVCSVSQKHIFSATCDTSVSWVGPNTKCLTCNNMINTQGGTCFTMPTCPPTQAPTEAPAGFSNY